MSKSPFDYITNISYKKIPNPWTEEDDRDYNSFVVNRTFSYFPDTVALANEMNFRHHAPPRTQFDFLINTARKRKRFEKWIKPIIGSDIEVIKKYYGYNTKHAEIVLSLLTAEQVSELRDKVSKGGRRK